MAPSPSREDEVQRVTPFLTKTYQLVNDHSSDDVVSWNSDGTGFVIWRPAEFARDILPLFFKHNNLSSFVRQLNTYAFRKISDRWEFTHASFRRGEKRLLGEIRRRRRFSPTPGGRMADGDASPTNSSEEQATTTLDTGGANNTNSNSNSNVSRQLEEENNILRQENRTLSEELGRMKKVCNNIFNLVSDIKHVHHHHHNNNNNNNKGELAANGSSSSGPTGPLQLLDLMPADEALVVHDHHHIHSSTKLFGVSIPANKPSRNLLLGDHMDLDINHWTLNPGTGVAGAAEPVQPDGHYSRFI